ncbi:DUF3570 domain-containing protein [Psychrobium sp. 1_MG-2023]|uniref:DUF3570 domain-containing protein n=1 Tax=Psychrobium sp. 1_MG-2023 TaxID=3062624 RepID=UPI002736EAAB|nr:DUF3570 domain-containing protein [Psychrobium sp. 1_MG-2023]MDP2562859.1 DUF3570 domain-containing protein [Psychrobium sp. 1_MG-2023]
MAVTKLLAAATTLVVLLLVILTGSLVPISVSKAAVLPKDRADVMYHSYQGGGMSIDGPSILIRKKMSKNISASFNHYVDTVSSASIDVLATASPYKEERSEQSLGLNYLQDNTLISVGVSQSNENDYQAKSFNFDLSHEFFGNLTTVTMGLSKGSDEITLNGNDNFFEQAEQTNYRLGLSQILTKNFQMGLNLEAITNQGYLNNPYRRYRYLDDASASGYSYATEIYPNTRTSTAGAIRGRYFLPYNAAVYASARLFSDTWGIQANNYTVGYSQSFADNWLIDVHLRYYQQDQADFYQDMFERKDQFNFMARDKEMSSFNDLTVGIKGRYLFKFARTSWAQASSVNVSLEHIKFDYDNFHNVLVTAPQGVGTEPLYQFSANVIRFYVSLWY